MTLCVQWHKFALLCQTGVTADRLPPFAFGGEDEEQKCLSRQQTHGHTHTCYFSHTACTVTKGAGM